MPNWPAETWLAAAIALATVVVAWAATAQLRLSNRLLELQKEVEEARRRVSVFARIRYVRNTTVEFGFAQLQVANLSPVGIWLESFEVKMDLGPGSASHTRPFTIEEVLAANEAWQREADSCIRSTMDSRPDTLKTLAVRTVGVEIIVRFIVHQQQRSQSTGRYLVDISQTVVSRVEPAPLSVKG